MNWSLFGSSGHLEPPDGLLIDSFIKRAKPDDRRARHVKSFVRTAAFRGPGPNPHAFLVDGPTVNVHGDTPEWEEPCITATPATYALCQINHYYFKSLSEWRLKLLRGYPDINIGKMDEERIVEEFRKNDCANVYDDSAVGRSRMTKRIIASLWP